MRNSLHECRRSRLSRLPLVAFIQRGVILGLLILVCMVGAVGQAVDKPDSSSVEKHDRVQSATEGIQRGWNEFGVWGGISFDSPTSLGLGTTPNARFGNIALRYGRVLAARKTVAFEWTIDVVPLSILSNNRF